MLHRRRLHSILWRLILVELLWVTLLSGILLGLVWWVHSMLLLNMHRLRSHTDILLWHRLLILVRDICVLLILIYFDLLSLIELLLIVLRFKLLIYLVIFRRFRILMLKLLMVNMSIHELISWLLFLLAII